MESNTNTAPLVVIVGPTASGKSELAMSIAQRFGGEIIAADSRTVYKGMDIGTAKPSQHDQKIVPHHLIDVVRPDEPFTVADFQYLASRAIKDISSRGKLPIMVGGSGLYIDAVIYNFSFRPPADPARRKLLQTLTVEELQAAHRQQGIALPNNSQNPRHLTRSLETAGELPAKTSLRPNTLVIGLLKDRSALAKTINDRVLKMLEVGLVQEVRTLADQYGLGAPALQATAYRAFRLYLARQISLNEAKERFVQNDLHYAKRQMTWFKRNEDINWISNPEEAVDMVTTFLNK